ncbi:AI-2E family transporter [soil metagenome]
MKIAKKTLIQFSVAALFIGGLYFIYLSKTVVLYVATALLLAVSMEPLIARLERRKISKVVAGSLVMLFLVLTILAVVAMILTPLAIQGKSLIENFPQITQNITSNPTFSNFANRYNIGSSLNELSSYISTLVLGGGSSIVYVASHIFSLVSSTAIVLVLTFLFLIEGEEIWVNLLHFLNPKDRVNAHSVGKEIKRAIGGFISGNLFISLIAGVVTLITLFLLRVPYIFALAALVALFDLIPLIGAAIATVVVGFVALTQGLTVALIAVIVLLIYQFVEGHFIQPIVYSRSIHLSPLFIITASIVGAEVAGIIGVLLAIPLGSIVQIVSKEIYKHYINRTN